MSVIIMRGIPGSGKTTWAQKHVGYFKRVVWPHQEQPDFPYKDLSSSYLFSADDYFVDKDNNYNFNKEQQSAAHQACLRQFVNYVSHAKDSVTLVVDNTNISLHEIAPYASLALAYDHTLKVATMLCDPIVAHKRNTHGVPKLVVHNMHQRLLQANLDFPSAWNHMLL